MSQMFRKKPVVIEATQFLGGNAGEIYDWMKTNQQNRRLISVDDDVRMKIETLEGDMWAAQNDWIIKGVKGEFYPCRPDIFEQTYERYEVMNSEVVEDESDNSG
jgi:hypothetical protein